MTVLEPLNLQEILVNNFAGNMTTFLAVAMIAFALWAVMFRMMNVVFLTLMMLFLLIMSAAGGGTSSLLIISIVAFGFAGYWILSKMIKQ